MEELDRATAARHEKAARFWWLKGASRRG